MYLIVNSMMIDMLLVFKDVYFIFKIDDSFEYKLLVRYV